MWTGRAARLCVRTPHHLRINNRCKTVRTFLNIRNIRTINLFPKDKPYRWNSQTMWATQKIGSVYHVRLRGILDGLRKCNYFRTPLKKVIESCCVVVSPLSFRELLFGPDHPKKERNYIPRHMRYVFYRAQCPLKTWRF